VCLLIIDSLFPAQPPFRCAVCTYVFTVPSGGFQSLETVFFVDSMVPSVSNGQIVTDPNNVKCQLCEEGELATTYCPECPSFLCKQCAGFHGRAPTSKHHKTASVEAALSGQNPSTKRIPRCPMHPIQEINTFCKTCKATVCPVCVTQAHSSHTFYPLSQEAETLRDEIMDSLVIASMREKEAKAGMTLFSGSLTTLDRNKTAAEEAIRSTFTRLHADLDARQLQLLGSLEEKKHGIRKTTELEKEETEFAFAELRGFRELTELLLIEGTPVEIAIKHSVVRVF